MCDDTRNCHPGGVGRTALLNARHSPAATIIVCYQALPYITDRPSPQRASVVVLVDPPGKPPLCPAVRITLHRLRHSDVAPAGGVYKPRAAATWASSAQGLVLRSAHYERIFLNAFHIPSLFYPPPHITTATNNMLLSFPRAFYGGRCVKCGRDSASLGFTLGREASWEDVQKWSCRKREQSRFCTGKFFG